MRTMNEEEMLNEYNRFKSNAESCGVWDVFVNCGFSESLKTAVCGLTNDTGCAYPGSLMVHVNYVVALATRISNMIAATFPIDKNSLIKCCMLQHISKLVMFETNDNQWEVEKRGAINKFSAIDGRLKCGLRSVYMALGNGVELTPIEVESITCLDRDNENGSTYDDIITTIIKQANELAYAIEKRKYGKM